MLDIDHFKRINDTFGHVTGDETLRAVAETLREQSRNADVIGRYGGEEFLVVMPHTDLAQARATAERLRIAVANLRFSRPELRLTISGGLAQYQGEELVPLIERADRLLYRAKHEGRDRIVDREES
jgi:diguanylate cyclase (GGDEF)-like protein